MKSRLAIMALAMVAALATAPPAGAQTAGPQVSAPFNISALHPQVQAIVIQARASEARGLAAAERAREAARLGQEAAQRARNGAAGTYVENLSWGDPLRSARYETEFSNDARNGYGAQTYTSGPWIGDTFSGQFVNGRKSGVGVYAFGANANNTDPGGAPQLRYEGEWADSVQAGYGFSTWQGGDRYAGGFADDTFNGLGVYRFADGSRWEGEFVNGAYVGLGVGWDENGQVLGQGVWSNNQLTTALAP